MKRECVMALLQSFLWAEPEPPPGGIKAGDLASHFTPPDGKTNSQCNGIELTPERMVRFSTTN